MVKVSITLTERKCKMLNDDWYDDRYLKPPASGKYLVYSKGGEFHVISYSQQFGLWNVTQDTSKAIEINCWTFLPTGREILERLITR